MRLLKTLLAIAALSAAPAVAAPAQGSPLAALKAAEAAVDARSAKDDGFSLDGSRGSPALLEKQWAAARLWTADWLRRHEGASPKALTDAGKAEAGLELSALRLDSDSLLVSADVGALGTAFILRRAADGRYVTALALDEPGTWGNGGPEALAAWRSDRADGCWRSDEAMRGGRCGPMSVASMTLLPQEADGARRFALAGRYVKAMGATDGYQVSIWRWTGKKAEPGLLNLFAQMADEPVIARIEGSRLELHKKGHFKRFFACGSCAGRQVEIDIELTSNGARIVGEHSLVPEMDRIDDLYDRLLQGRSATDLASPAVIATLNQSIRVMARVAVQQKFDASNLGILGAWKTSVKDGRRTVCLEADGLDHGQQFTFAGRDATGRIEKVEALAEGACEGPGARS